MRIGEVARRSGVSARMLRHYDAIGLVVPSGRTSAGYREYSADDVVRIFHVESLRALGLSLREVGRALDDPAFAPAELIAELIDRAQQRIARERELVERLGQVQGAGPDGWESVLDVIGLLAALQSGDASGRQRAAFAAGDTAVSGDALAKALLAEDDPNVAGALQWAVARSVGDVAAVLDAALDSDDVQVRRRAVTALIETGAVERLPRAVHDGDRVVAGRAALGLAAAGDDSVVPALVEMVADGVADVEAADALAAFDQPERVAGLLAVALHAADVPARRRLAQALGEVGGPEADRALAPLVDDADEGTAVIARYLLDRRRAPDRGRRAP